MSKRGPKPGKKDVELLKHRPLKNLTGPEVRRIYLGQIANDPEAKRRYKEWIAEEQWDLRVW